MKKVLLIIMLLHACVSVAQVVSDELLTAWGFENNPRSTYLSEFCAGSVLPLAIGIQGIKAINKQTESGLKQRFTLGKAVYQSIDQAMMAVDEINNPPSRTTKHAKMCDLKQAIHIGYEVYFVHTDVGQFKNDIKPMLDKLSLYIESIN